MECRGVDPPQIILTFICYLTFEFWNSVTVDSCRLYLLQLVPEVRLFWKRAQSGSWHLYPIQAPDLFTFYCGGGWAGWPVNVSVVWGGQRNPSADSVVTDRTGGETCCFIIRQNLAG
jgi:hypothetical protein